MRTSRCGLPLKDSSANLQDHLRHIISTHDYRRIDKILIRPLAFPERRDASLGIIIFIKAVFG